jgi:cytochrome P450
MMVAPDPPRHKGHWLTGSMADFNRDPLEFITQCARSYGDIVRLRFLTLPALFLFHPEQVEEVLVTNNGDFIKSRAFRTRFFRRLLGHGLLTAEGELWRRQRRLMQPAFHHEAVIGYAGEMIGCAERLVAGWRDGEVVDVHEAMMGLTRDIVVRTLFSTDVSGSADAISSALRELSEPFTSQATLKWIADNWLPTARHRRFHREARRLEQVIYDIIAARRASGRDEGDLLSVLLRAQGDDGVAMTDEQLRDEVMTIFLAGHETTALALSWAWYLLAQNPAAEDKLLAEVDEVAGGRPLRAEDAARLRYVERIVKETLRLYPPAFGVGREAVRPCRIGGHRVRRSTQVFMFQWVIHRDPRFYEDPEAFNPDRWAEGAAQHLPRFAYFPFSGGPRACIGGGFAMQEAVLLLAAIAQRYQFRLAAQRPVRIAPGVSLRPRDGILMRLRRRGADEAGGSVP